ncbi:hypothetical protein Tco_0725945 [Tanacetum coccineum]|uniref:Uncharacterized protein n=1 Tax=Tanacetum coccineum TaxID=301880 RepID=A0ABQ4YEA0_9ASTR
MNDPNITMDEYIRLEEEKAQKHGKVFNRETAKYGKIWYDEDVHDLRSIKTEFPAIVFNDNLSSNEMLSCEPKISSLNNNKINFRISFDEFDEEDYTVVFDKNSFSYKISSTNDLKMDAENDNEKVNMPLFPSAKPSISCIDNLDFFKDFENEFPAIVYNDALTSKSDFSTEPTICPQHIDEFDLKNETLLSEYDEVEQNILYFNDLFPFNIIYPNDSKMDTDNDNDKVDIEHSSRDLSVKPLPDVINTDVGAYAHGSNKLLETMVYRDCCFDETFLEDLDQTSTHMVAVSKVPMLKLGEFKLWRMRIEQYIQVIDYALWEVIENDATMPKTQVVEVKFNSIKDAKKLLEAVEKRFGGNAATKKTQRNILK